MLWYSDLAVNVQSRLRDIEWSDLLGDRRIAITSRAKTVDTLRQKLQRDPSTPLPNVQDIAGVRVEADMTLREQDEVGRRIAREFDHDPSDSRVWRDIRESPHSGYRALHIWLRLDDGRVEVQVRTKIQSAWANLYETVADVLGREIRYGQQLDDPTRQTIVAELQGKAIDPGSVIEQVRQDLSDIESEVPRFVWRLMFPIARRHGKLVRGLRELEAEFISELSATRSKILEIRDRGGEA